MLSHHLGLGVSFCLNFCLINVFIYLLHAPTYLIDVWLAKIYQNHALVMKSPVIKVPGSVILTSPGLFCHCYRSLG